MNFDAHAPASCPRAERARSRAASRGASHRVFAASLVAASVLFACGASNPPAKSEGSSGSGGRDGAASLSDQKRAFMTGCTSKVPNAPDYCQCAWELFAKTFTKKEMASPNSDDPAYQKKLADVKEQVSAACASKMPEDSIKASFIKGCAKDPKLQDYCSCKYVEYRKRFTASELTDDEIVKTPRFGEARRGVVKACGAKMAEGPAQTDFIASCAGAGGQQAYCACAWKAARKTWSVAEIVESTMDKKDVLDKVNAVCGAPTPAKN